jgi:hypothetical protein
MTIDKKHLEQMIQNVKHINNYMSVILDNKQKDDPLCKYSCKLFTAICKLNDSSDEEIVSYIFCTLEDIFDDLNNNQINLDNLKRYITKLKN